jgi:hypothetical protein
MNNTDFRLICVTELDYDGPEILILSVSVSAPDSRVFADLGIVIQRKDGGHILTALTSAIDDEADDASGWLQDRCDELQSQLNGALPPAGVRDAVVNAFGLDAIDWSVLDQAYAERRHRNAA